MSTSWKRLLGEAQKLRGVGRHAWRVAQIVRGLFYDEAFRKEGCSGRLGEVEKRLAFLSGSYGLGVNDMVQMIEHFPLRKDWVSGRLDILRDKTCKILSKRSPKPATAKQKVKRDVVTKSQFEELKSQYESAWQELQEYKKSHVPRTTVSALQEKIQRLKDENIRLKNELVAIKGSHGRRKSG